MVRGRRKGAGGLSNVCGRESRVWQGQASHSLGYQIKHLGLGGKPVLVPFIYREASGNPPPHNQDRKVADV